MRKIVYLFIFFYFILLFVNHSCFAKDKIAVKLFYSPSCSKCIKVKEQFLPGIISKYKDKIEIEYFDIKDQENYKVFLSLSDKYNNPGYIPSILVGDLFLNGSGKIIENLARVIDEYIKNPNYKPQEIKEVNLVNKFSSFSFLTIIGAGLIDGVNPCAFTVLIFFISFLTLMGYRKKDVLLIGAIFILAVFLTYLLLGLGLFQGLYQLKNFYIFLKVTYYVLAIFCFSLAYLNLKDFFIFKRTNKTEEMNVKLPKAVRNYINKIISMFYRRQDKTIQVNIFLLTATTFLVGFLISLLEAICTGQVYLPTIVFILKEPALRLKAVYYLILYNLMFVAPLMLILGLVIMGTSSSKLEAFFKEKIALVKIFMFILFLGLGILLVVGV